MIQFTRTYVCLMTRRSCKFSPRWSSAPTERCDPESSGAPVTPRPGLQPFPRSAPVMPPAAVPPDVVVGGGRCGVSARDRVPVLRIRRARSRCRARVRRTHRVVLRNRTRPRPRARPPVPRCAEPRRHHPRELGRRATRRPSRWRLSLSGPLVSRQTRRAVARYPLGPVGAHGLRHRETPPPPGRVREREGAVECAQRTHSRSPAGPARPGRRSTRRDAGARNRTRRPGRTRVRLPMAGPTRFRHRSPTPAVPRLRPRLAQGYRPPRRPTRTTARTSTSTWRAAASSPAPCRWRSVWNCGEHAG